MTFKLNQVPLTSTAATLVLNSVPAQGASVVFTNSSSSVEIYLGFGTGVTVSTGAPLPPYAVLPMRDFVGTVPVYGIAASGTVPVGIWFGDLQ